MSQVSEQVAQSVEAWKLEAVLIPAEGNYAEYVQQISLERINLAPYINIASEDDLDAMAEGDYDWILSILNSNVVEVNAPYAVEDLNDINWDAVSEYISALRLSRA